jgi:hypothetical protein
MELMFWISSPGRILGGFIAPLRRRVQICGRMVE